jgi:hypothetical protein
MKQASAMGRHVCAATLALVTSVASAALPAAAASLNPDADEILQSMAKFLASAKTFSVSADISNEIVTQDGQKLQQNSYVTVLIERSSHFYLTRHGKVADAALFYDGNTLTMYGKGAQIYAQMNIAGNIDDAINALESRTQLDFPGSDLLLSNPYAVLSSGITSSGYYGTAYVQGVECHHLAFRKDKVDWQVWVKTGAEPLPMKYVITTKWTTGAPQYTAQFTGWNLKPSIASGQFTFTPPKDAKKVDALPTDEAGEIVANQETK